MDTARLTNLVQYLTNSILTPMLVADPCYIQIQADLQVIILQILRQEGYDLDNLPQTEEGFIILHAKKEVYMRLATSQAPNYDLEAQYTKILKSKRFDHYIKLVQMVQLDIDKIRPNIQVDNVLIDGRNWSRRNYELAGKQVYASIVASSPTTTTINLDWEPYDPSVNMFEAYDLIVSLTQIYDPYSEPPLNLANPVYRNTIHDFKRTQLRVSNLTPATLYYVTMVYRAVCGNNTIVTTTITTLS